MSYANHINRKAELAIQQYLKEAELTLTLPESILAGLDDGEIIAPRVVISCTESEPNGPVHDAIWDSTVAIIVCNKCDDSSKESHDSIAGEVFSQFFLGQFETAVAITEATDYFTAQWVQQTKQETRIEDRNWVSILILKITCCGSAVSI